MSIDIGNIVVSEATPSGNISSDPSMDDWVWLKPSTGVWHNYNPSTGEWDEVDVPVHAHPTLGDIDFLGDISVGGVAGITGEYEGAFKKVKIENGIITEFELE